MEAAELPFTSPPDSPDAAAPTGVLGSLKQMGVVEVLQALTSGGAAVLGWAS